MKKITFLLVAILSITTFVSAQSPLPVVKAIDELLLTSDHITLSLKFTDPDSGQRFTWIIKNQTEFTPFTGGFVTAVDGSLIDISGLQPETSYEVRISLDTFMTYVSYPFTTPAVVGISKEPSAKAFTAHLTGTTLAIESDIPKKFKIYNIIGNQVAEGMVDGGGKNLDLVTLPTGYYFVSDGSIVIRIFLSPN